MAQREGVLDYRDYPGDDPIRWKLKEMLLFAEIERGLMARYCLTMMAGGAVENRQALFDRLLGYDMPWVSKANTEAKSPERLVELYKKMKSEARKHG